jgi:hypothetical protein
VILINFGEYLSIYLTMILSGTLIAMRCMSQLRLSRASTYQFYSCMVNALSAIIQGPSSCKG